MFNPSLPFFRSIAFIWASLSLSCFAQSFDYLAPKQPNVPERDWKIPEAPKTKADKDDMVLVERLKGMVFAPKQKEIPAEVSKKEGITTINLTLLKEEKDFKKKLSPYIDKPVSINLLRQITRDVIVFYREKGRPVVDVFIPEQDITGGIVQFIVVEGHVGKVKVDGNQWFSSKLLTDQITEERGDVIRTKNLRRELKWLNRNPFRQADLAFTPGEQLGETDLCLHVKDRFPLRLFTGYEDTGNDATGEERWYAGFNWGNAWSLGHMLSYQFTTSSDFNALTAHSAIYSIPFPWKHEVSVFGSYVESNAEFFSGTTNSKGKSWQVGMRYAVPLPYFDIPLLHTSYEHEVEWGFDFKQSNNNLEFGGQNVFSNLTDITQWVLDYHSKIKDDFGVTTFRGTVYYSPGGWTDNSKDVNYNQARQYAEAEYAYSRAEVERLTRLPWDFSFINRFAFQLADGNLLSSEQMGFGGYDTVRGYDEREVSGDEGFRMTLELRTPPVSLFDLFGEGKQDQLQFLFFWDYGEAKLRDVPAGLNDNIEVSSIGPGLRYTITPYLSVRADYGFQLIDAGNSRYASRLHLGVTCSY